MRRRLIGAIAICALPLVVVFGAMAIAYETVAMRPPPRLGDDARAAAMAPLRAVLDGKPPSAPKHPDLDRELAGNGPVIVSAWSYGRRSIRVEGHGLTTAAAIADAAQQLSESAELATWAPERRGAARLQVDVVVARAPLLTRWKATTALGVIPGVDGVGANVLHRDIVLAPDELVSEKLLNAVTPIPMAPEFRVGLEFVRTDSLLAKRAALGPGEYGAAAKTYFRLRTDSFVERPIDARAAGAPLPLTRGLPPGPELTEANLLQASKWGGEYLLAHIADGGRYVYEVDLTRGMASDPKTGAYSLPRHAGTSYYLAELYEVTKDPALREGLIKVFDHLEELIKQGGCTGTTKDGRPFRCVVDRGQAETNLGSTALAVVALAEYRLATGDDRYDETLRALSDWMMDLQKPNGRFAHIYNVKTKVTDWETELLYFDGEAALALIRAYRVFKDERYIKAAGQALDGLVAQYDFFAGQFFFGEEHWTCISAEAGWPELNADRYREFCSDYAAFLREQQFDPEAEIPDQPDLGGAYSVTPFFVPHNTPAGSRSEAMVSAYLLTKYHGRPDPLIRRQVLATMRYTLRQQIRPDNDWFTPARAALGAMPSSSIDRNVRIDYVQHTCSAMLRSIELLADEHGK